MHPFRDAEKRRREEAMVAHLRVFALELGALCDRLYLGFIKE
jgi:hypothetical protein